MFAIMILLEESPWGWWKTPMRTFQAFIEYQKKES